jgi:hypothetical protein
MVLVKINGRNKRITRLELIAQQTVNRAAAADWRFVKLLFELELLTGDRGELLPDAWPTEKIADDPNVYEWWYFDIHNHDRTVITGMLSPQSAIGRVPRFGTPRALSRIDVLHGSARLLASRRVLFREHAISCSARVLGQDKQFPARPQDANRFFCLCTLRLHHGALRPHVRDLPACI